jgi:hypothetical protein
MDIGDFLNKVYDQSIDFGMNAFVTGVIGASLGYTIASIDGVDKFWMAQAFAIYSIAVLIFDRYCEEYIPNNGIINSLTVGVAFKIIPAFVFTDCVNIAMGKSNNIIGACFFSVVITGYILKRPIEQLLS